MSSMLPQDIELLKKYSTVLSTIADNLNNLANNESDDTLSELSSIRNTCLGHDKSFCVNGETMFVVSTGEAVVVGEECGVDLVRTFDHNGAYRKAMDASELTHNMYDCWDVLIKDCNLPASEYRKKYKVTLKPNQTAQQAIRNSLVERARELATAMTTYQLSGINVYNTKDMSSYNKFNADNITCPKCGNPAFMCNTNYDDCYFQCDKCGSSHWFTRNSPDEAVNVPEEMRKWDEQVNGKYGEDNV